MVQGNLKGGPTKWPHFIFLGSPFHRTFFISSLLLLSRWRNWNAEKKHDVPKFPQGLMDEVADAFLMYHSWVLSRQKRGICSGVTTQGVHTQLSLFCSTQLSCSFKCSLFQEGKNEFQSFESPFNQCITLSLYARERKGRNGQDRKLREHHRPTLVCPEKYYCIISAFV